MNQEDNAPAIIANFELVQNEPIEAVFTLSPNVADLSYTHYQDVAQDHWVITHGLGKYPSVTIVTSAGEQIQADVQYISSNVVEVSFVGAFAGVAYLN